MSKHSEAFTTIDSTDLSLVNGGEGHGSATFHLPTGAGATVSGSINTTDYKECMDAARRTAEEAYPDRRNPWELLTNAVDPNAQRRAAYERQASGACPAVRQPSSPRS